MKGYALGYAHAMMLARLVVNSTKRYVGYWRPYFYDECDFADDAPYDCDHSARGDDMYKSFPSGHAAMSMCALLHTSWVLLGRARLAEGGAARGGGERRARCGCCAKPGGARADDDEARRRELDLTSFKIAACLAPAFLAWSGDALSLARARAPRVALGGARGGDASRLPRLRPLIAFFALFALALSSLSRRSGGSRPRASTTTTTTPRTSCAARCSAAASRRSSTSGTSRRSSRTTRTSRGVTATEGRRHVARGYDARAAWGQGD